MKVSCLRRSLLFASAVLFASIAWVPGRSRSPSAAGPPLLTPPPAASAPSAASQPQAPDARRLAQAQADPNAAEYYYQQALLALGENRKGDAVALLRVYAQSGRNPRQLARALKFIAEINRN